MARANEDPSMSSWKRTFIRNGKVAKPKTTHADMPWHDMTWHANVTTRHDGYHFISFHPLHYGVYQSVCFFHALWNPEQLIFVVQTLCVNLFVSIDIHEIYWNIIYLHKQYCTCRLKSPISRSYWKFIPSDHSKARSERSQGSRGVQVWRAKGHNWCN